MTEQLNSVEKRKIINGLLEQVMQKHPDLYYSPTTEVARMVHEQLQSTMSRLPIEDQMLMKKVSVRDVEIILSLN
jgi:BMFP domain-containing protein YqiC